MSKKYVLIDFENVQPEIPSGWKCADVEVQVFLGTHHKSIPKKFAIAAQELGSNLEYIEFHQQGKDALDSYIKLRLGRLIELNPKAKFEIVSNDKGYDSLLRQLRSEGIHAVRIGQITAEKITAIRPEVQKPHIQIVIANLQNTKTKPRSLKKLENAVASWLRGKATQTEIGTLVAELQSSGVVSIWGTELNYLLPDHSKLRVHVA